MDREQSTRALERALVRQGGSVLQPGSAELEPGLDYAYDDPGGGRHDRLLSQLSLRLGLPWEAQADLRLPYVLVERTVGLGRTSGLGDLELGLTKLLVHEQGVVPELLATGRWRASTGRSAGAVSPGSGAHGLEALLTALVRDDPVVLVGSLYYVRNLPAHDVDLGDVVGLAFNANLAATPDTSLFVGLDVAAFTSLRVQGETVPRSEGLSGVLNLGFGHILGSRLAMNLTAGIGVTRDAPRFQLALALPLRL